MRTYYIWQIPESPDTSYQFGVFGLWSDAELSVGIIISCFPVMPKFFQHVRPKVYEAFSFRSKPTDALGQDPERRSKTPRAGTLIQKKNPFAKYKAGPSILETRDDPYTQPHGEYYTLNESEPSQRQGATTFDPIRGSFPGTSTRREDLEYGHYNPEAVGERSSTKNAH